MDIYMIKIHGYNCFYGKNGFDWFIADKTKNKFIWTPTIITEERQKIAKKVTIQELILEHLKIR